jgi:hypothetical protein
MVKEEGFKEGIESYRKRLKDELIFMDFNNSGFVDARNNNHQVKDLIKRFRDSAQKINLYLSYMEEIVENNIRAERLIEDGRRE